MRYGFEDFLLRFRYQRTDPDDEEFAESNLMHSVNGYVYGNQPMITMRQGERVRWHVMTMGTESTCTHRTGTATTRP